MPSKRVSLKGKGADLFFGDYSPDTPSVLSEPPDGEASTVAVVTDSPPSASTQPDLDDGLPPSDSSNGIRSESKSTIVRDSKLASSPLVAQASARAANNASSLAPPLARTPASKLTFNSESKSTDVIEAIRKIVKVSGKEVSYTRLTPEEKAQLVDIVYAFKRQGQKTTENEIHRIALNYLLSDYHARGEQSVLALVLAALQA